MRGVDDVPVQGRRLEGERREGQREERGEEGERGGDARSARHGRSPQNETLGAAWDSGDAWK